MKQHIDAETEFLQGLIELQYGQDVQDKLATLSQKIPWAKGWPTNNISFWNAESFMWSQKIDADVRDAITLELSTLKGKNLDLGCGAYSYIPSVGFDFSTKMLGLNDNAVEKIQGDVEEALPFPNNSFDSVTAIFLLNYVTNYTQLFSEVKRILQKDGRFVMVLSAVGLNSWQKQKQVNDFSPEQWIEILKKSGFDVKMLKKEKYYVWKCS